MGAFIQAGKSTGSAQGGSAPTRRVSRRNWSWGKLFPPTVLAMEAPKAPEAREVRGMYGVPTNRVPRKEQLAYEQALKDYNAKQSAAHTYYQSLWDKDPFKFVNTMAADLKSGKITQEYFDWQYTAKDRMKLRTQVESQAAAKAEQEKALAQQREVAKQAELAAQRLAQQQRTLQNLDAEQEGSSATVVSGRGNAPIGSAGGRRRRGARLSAVLGI